MLVFCCFKKWFSFSSWNRSSFYFRTFSGGPNVLWVSWSVVANMRWSYKGEWFSNFRFVFLMFVEFLALILQGSRSRSYRPQLLGDCRLQRSDDRAVLWPASRQEGLLRKVGPVPRDFPCQPDRWRTQSWVRFFSSWKLNFAICFVFKHSSICS